MNEVWIVDDDQSIRWVLERALSREGFDVRAFASANECLSAFESGEPKVLVSDIRMPGASGIELLQQVKQRRPGLPVIIMTAFSDLDSAVSAFQGGAFEYLPKPFDLPKAVELIRRAVAESDREAAAEELIPESPEMLGQAPAMQEVFRAIGRLSQSNVTVMITGESGSGKELIAQALHRHSARANQPFVALNAAAIPRDLLESELFGHERGAFTGANTDRKGWFELADGGTLFLDEIGDMPAQLQAKLLRVLEDGEITPVGASEPKRVDVRLVSATNADLQGKIASGAFRQDLYFRLARFVVETPPLRSRPEDIPGLAAHFLEIFSAEMGLPPPTIKADALAALSAYSYPGNVRELKNLIERALISCGGKSITKEHLQFSGALSSTPTIESASAVSLPLNLEDAEQELIRRAVEQTGGNIAEARQQGTEFLEAAIQRIPHGRIAQQPCDMTLLCLQGDE